MNPNTRSNTNVGAMAAFNKAAATFIPPPEEKKSNKSTKRKVGKQTKEITLEELEELDQKAIDLVEKDHGIEYITNDSQTKTFFDQREFETILQNMSIPLDNSWLDIPIVVGLQNEALGYYLNQGYRFQDPVTERVLIDMEVNEAVQILFNSQTGEAEVVSLTPTQKTFIGSGIAFYRYYKNVSNGIIRDPIIKIDRNLLSYLKIMYNTLSMFQASKELDDELQQSAKERNTGGYELVRYVDPKAIFSISGQPPFVVVQPFTRNFEDTGLGRQINSFYDDDIFIDPQKPFNMIKSNIIINTALALALNNYLKFKTPVTMYDYENSIKVFMGIGYKNDANWNNFDLARVFGEATQGNIEDLLSQQLIPGSNNLIFSSENSGIQVDNVSPLASSSYDYNVALKFVKRPNIIYGVVISIIYGPNMKYFIASNSANEKEEIVLPCKLQLSKIFIDTTNMVVVFELRIIQELTTVVLKSKWESVINKELLPHIQKMYKGKKKGKKEVLLSQGYSSEDLDFFSSDLNPNAGGSKLNRKSKTNRKTNRKTKRRNNKRRKTKRRTNKRRTNKRRI